jgi:hypothetical protein
MRVLQKLPLPTLILLSIIANISYSLPIKILLTNDLEAFSVIEETIVHTGSDAYIVKVTDGKNIYILKQINDSSIDEQFLLINDCVSSTIGTANGISVNAVSFIPFDVAPHLKPYPDRAATLHVIVNGKDLESELPDNLLEHFTLHQRVVNPNSPWQKKYPLADNQQGLDKTIIESMSLHKDLSALVALDTFIGNSDRSLPNIFYDKKSNSFYGIDQAAAFTKKLPLLACERLQELVSQDYFLSCDAKIIHSLRPYRYTLSKLRVIKPDSIVEAIQELVPHLAFQASLNADVINRVSYHRDIIEKNYAASAKLITLIDKILASSFDSAQHERKSEYCCIGLCLTLYLDITK